MRRRLVPALIFVALPCAVSYARPAASVDAPIERAIDAVISEPGATYIEVDGTCNAGVFTVSAASFVALQPYRLTNAELVRVFGAACANTAGVTGVRGDSLFVASFDVPAVDAMAARIVQGAGSPVTDIAVQKRHVRGHERGHAWFNRAGFARFYREAMGPGMAERGLDADVLLRDPEQFASADEVFADAYGLCAAATQADSTRPGKAFMAWRQSGYFVGSTHNTTTAIDDAVVSRLFTTCLALPPSATEHDKARAAARVLFQGPWDYLVTHGPGR